MAQTHSLDLERDSSQYASISDGSQTGLDVTSDFTIEAWIRLESTPSSGNNYTIFCKWGNNQATNQSYVFEYLNASGTTRLYLTVNDGTNIRFGNVALSLTSGIWYHVSCSFTAGSSTIALYVNSMAQSVTHSGTAITSVLSGTGDAYVGAFNDGSIKNYFDGLIKDVRFFNDVRSAAEIASDVYLENVSNANLKAEWNFNNAYTDSSGNSNTLTATNSPTFSTTVPWTAPSGITGTDLETSLVAYYELEEASGTRADSTASGYNLTENNGTIANAAGIQGNAADLEASSSQYFSKSNETALQFTGAFAVSFWAKLESLPQNPSYYPIHKTDETNGWGFTYAHSGGVLSFAGYSGGANKFSINDPAGFTTGTWYHVVATGDGSTLVELYVNGKAVAFGAASGAVGAYTGQMNLGKHVTLGRYYDGLIDEVAFWNRRLHYGEVLDLYAAGAAIPYSGATAYMQDLDETITLVDTKKLTTGKAIKEVATMVATIARSMARVFTEVVTLVSTTTPAPIFTKEYTENITVTDTMSRQAGKLISETATLVATIARSMARTLTDTVTPVASEIVNIVYARAFSEAVEVVDTIAKKAGKLLQETAILVETFAKRLAAIRLTETVTLVATIANIHGYFKSLTETVTLTATLSKVSTFARSLVESVGVTDRLRGLLNGLNMLLNGKYAEKAGSYFSKYLNNK